MKDLIIIKHQRRVKSKNYPALGRPSKRPYSDFLKSDDRPYQLKLKYDEEKIYKELSDKLYTDHFCSIRELAIQNPFDIDATEVHIIFDKAANQIIFEDNGSGMDRKTIFKNFLVIGSSSKEHFSKTRVKKRPLIGNKGIGRLSWQKLGKYTRIITETKSSAHQIEMHQYDMHVRVTRIARSGRTGTKWVISNLIPGLNEQEIKEYIQKKASVLLGIHKDFKIFLNGRRIIPYRSEGDRMKLSGKNFSSILIFNNQIDTVKVTCNHLVVDEIEIEGLGGFIESSKFNITTNREQVVKDDAYHKIIKSLKSAILNELTRIAFVKRDILRKYREVFIRFAASSNNGSSFQRLKLAREIPVLVLGQNWVKLGDLKSENIYVEVSFDGSPSPKAERASELNFPIIIAASDAEKLLIKSLTSAEDLSKLPGDLLDGKGRTIRAAGEYKTLLSSAADVLRLMTEVNFAIMPDEEFSSSHRGIVTNTEPIMVKFHSEKSSETAVRSEFIEEKVKKSKLPKDRPKYIITRSNADHIFVNGISIALCEMDRYDINALANPSTKEIFINVNSIVVQKIFEQEEKVQKVLLMEEISHELAHLLGYGLVVHDTPFFKIQRMLKYVAMQAM